MSPASAASTEFSFDVESARRLPANIRFGTSTWTYPGWKGLVYKRPYKNEKEFKARCLEEYAEVPWFRSIGIDNTFYTPPSSKQLASYASALPENFQWVSKVWERITIPRYPKHARYGKQSGSMNPDFLNADLFSREVLDRFSVPEIFKRTGPFVFQFQTMGKALVAQLDFLTLLRAFLKKLPKQFRYAIEIRDAHLLEPRYFDILNESAATHCFNHWHIMPPLHEQMKRAAEAGGLQAAFYVSRILTPLGIRYEDAVKMFEPYDVLKKPNPEMRKDVARLARRAIERDVDAFIIVNNRSEGSAPMTIDALGRLITSEI